MKAVDFELIAAYLFPALGMGLILFAIFRKNKTALLVDTGIKAEGTVVRLEQSPGNHRDNSTVMDKVTVEFTTKSNQTITAEITQDFAFFYTGQYSVGEKVELYYDPAAPSRFYVTTGQSESNSRLFFAAAGIVLSTIGLYLLYRH